MMKMILAVMPTSLSDTIAGILLDAEYRVTKFASTAGLLSGGTTTLMIVAEADRIQKALSIIRENIPPENEETDKPPRVTIYVLEVKDFRRV